MICVYYRQQLFNPQNPQSKRRDEVMKNFVNSLFLTIVFLSLVIFSAYFINYWENRPITGVITQVEKIPCLEENDQELIFPSFEITSASGMKYRLFGGFDDNSIREGDLVRVEVTSNFPNDDPGVRNITGEIKKLTP